MAEPYYTTEDDLRTELGVDSSTLDDASAIRLIEDAEDVIDQMLGAWIVDEDSGRKIVEADVEAWQWSKLGRATVKLAAKLYRDPTIADGRQWDSMSGPDFSVSGAQNSRIGEQIEGILNASQLRRLTGRAGNSTSGDGRNNAFIAEEFYRKDRPAWSSRD